MTRDSPTMDELYGVGAEEADADAMLEEEEPVIEEPEDEPARASDMSELAGLLEQATAASQEEKRLKQARKRLVQIQKHSHPNQEQEQLDLLAEINRLEEKRVWHTIGCVALFYCQECSTCGGKHKFFNGWFTVRTHATDKHLRDLKLGEPTEPGLPRWIEVEDRGMVPICADCCEAQIAIDIATGKYPGVQ